MLWAALCPLLAAIACKRPAEPSDAGPATSSSAPASWADEALGPRLEAVARADALAVQGSKSDGPEALARLEHAATIRTRLYRRERRAADALEAQELWKKLARAGGPRRCDAERHRIELAGELSGDAAATYRELHALLAQGDGACADRVRAALSLLEAFRPDESVLRASSGASAAASAAPRATTSATAPSGAVQSATLTHIDHYSAKDAARVVVFVSKPVRFEVGSLAAEAGRGARLYVDLQGAHYAGKSRLDAQGLLERVRAVDGPRGTRVVLDLAQAAEHRVFYVPEPFRLIIDVARPDAASKPSRNVRRVVLDPGHGGHDPGAVGPSGLREKDVALDIAHRAAPLIARELGISTLLTRDTDVFVPLEERTARANAFGADLFISIHCNATERGSSSGVMTFVLDESKDQLASRIAALENSASAEATSELAQSLSRSADRASDARSSEFASLLQRAAMASLAPSYPDVPDGGVKRAGFYVLAGARMPAVLFETSFISSARDETRFNTGDFRQKLADAIVNAVRAYKEGRGAPRGPE